MGYGAWRAGYEDAAAACGGKDKLGWGTDRTVWHS
jgi:hypothetical protein